MAVEKETASYEAAAGQQKPQAASYKIPIFAKQQSVACEKEEEASGGGSGGGGYYLNVAQKGKLILPTTLWILLILAGICFVSLLASLNKSINTLDTLVELEQSRHHTKTKKEHSNPTHKSASERDAAELPIGGKLFSQTPTGHHHLSHQPHEPSRRHEQLPAREQVAAQRRQEEEDEEEEALVGSLFDDMFPVFGKLMEVGLSKEPQLDEEQKPPMFANLGNMFVHLSDAATSQQEEEEAKPIRLRPQMRPAIKVIDASDFPSANSLDSNRLSPLASLLGPFPMLPLPLPPPPPPAAMHVHQKHHFVLGPHGVPQLVASVSSSPDDLLAPSFAPSRETNRFGLSNTRRPNSLQSPYELRQPNNLAEKLSDELASSFIDNIFDELTKQRKPNDGGGDEEAEKAAKGETSAPTTATGTTRTTVFLDGKPIAASSNEPPSNKITQFDAPSAGELGDQLVDLMLGGAQKSHVHKVGDEKPFEFVEIKPVEAKKQTSAAQQISSSTPQIEAADLDKPQRVEQAATLGMPDGLGEILDQMLTLPQFGGEQKPQATGSAPASTGSSQTSPSSSSSSQSGQSGKGKLYTLAQKGIDSRLNLLPLDGAAVPAPSKSLK